MDLAPDSTLTVANHQDIECQGSVTLTVQPQELALGLLSLRRFGCLYGRSALVRWEVNRQLKIVPTC